MLKKIKIYSITMTLLLLYLLSAWHTIEHIHCSQSSIRMESSIYCDDITCGCQNKGENKSDESHKSGNCKVVVDHIVASVENVPLSVSFDTYLGVVVTELDVQLNLPIKRSLEFFDDNPLNQYLIQSKTLRAPPVCFFV